MHLAARALCLALVPSIAAAQAETRYPATQQPQPHPTAAATPDAGRYLVVACPTATGTPSALSGQPADSVTRALVATLCARAQTGTTLQQGAALAARALPPDTEAELDPQPLGARESAIDLLMRLAEAPAGTAPTLLDTAAGHAARPGPSRRSSRQPTSARQR